jgi:K+/H+ antiporter YhaU regulatory subunit KhtT
MPKKKPLIVYRSEAEKKFQKNKPMIKGRQEVKKMYKEQTKKADQAWQHYEDLTDDDEDAYQNYRAQDAAKMAVGKVMDAGKKKARKTEKIGERLTGLAPKKHKTPEKPGKKMIKKAKYSGALPGLLMKREIGMRGGLKPKSNPS